jgi:V-type H+-transporting ATPase subunit F
MDNSADGAKHVTDPPDSQKNFLVVDSKTEDSTIEGAFDSFTKERKDIAILLINQHVRQHTTQVDRVGVSLPGAQC